TCALPISERASVKQYTADASDDPKYQRERSKQKGVPRHWQQLLFLTKEKEKFMGYRIQDVISYLEQVAPPAYQEGYDNATLICGDRKEGLKGVLCSLDCTEAVVDEAISLGANLIVAHHPIVFKGLKSLTGRNYVERTVIRAIKNDVAIYAIHTNLDHVATGVNKRICDRLGLSQTRILRPKKDILSKLVFFL